MFKFINKNDSRTQKHEVSMAKNKFKVCGERFEDTKAQGKCGEKKFKVCGGNTGFAI